MSAASAASGTSVAGTAKAASDADSASSAAAQKAAALSGAVKAALWLLSADEDVAIATLQLLTHEEVRRIRQVAETLQRVSPEELARVHHEFKYILEQQPLRLRGSVRYLSRLATRAYGETTASALLRLPEEEIPAAYILGTGDAQTLATSLREEHPQIIAAVLSSLAPARASALVAYFSEALRDDVLSRLASLKMVPSESLRLAQRHLRDTMPTVPRSDASVDGVRLAATVLNEAGNQEAERALTSLTTRNQDLAGAVRSAMFVFDDLERLDKRGVQTLLKDVPSDRLGLALRNASEGFKEKIFAGMSMRAAEMMREDMLAAGPTKLADVQAAQKDIVAVATRLRDEGKITLGGGSGQAGFV